MRKEGSTVLKKSNNPSETRKLRSEQLREAIVFSMLGALMFCSKILMEVLPNIHMLGMLTMVYTIVFRARALIPIYIYVTVNGVYAGFSVWWIPYLYIWAILWGITMLLPRRMPRRIACIVYAAVCALHGILFGILYAPAQALMFGFTLEQTVAWILSGLPFDLLHAIGNLALGTLILPLSEILRRLMYKAIPRQ